MHGFAPVTATHIHPAISWIACGAYNAISWAFSLDAGMFAAAITVVGGAFLWFYSELKKRQVAAYKEWLEVHKPSHLAQLEETRKELARVLEKSKTDLETSLKAKAVELDAARRDAELYRDHYETASDQVERNTQRIASLETQVFQMSEYVLQASGALKSAALATNLVVAPKPGPSIGEDAAPAVH